MRIAILLAAAAFAWGQTPDPAYQPLSQAYEALRVHNYDGAIAAFLRAAEAAPARASIRKDLAFVYLKIGENVLAREQFREAMRLDPADTGAALEYAFLCAETKEQAEARRVFDRIRKTGNATAEQAFQNIDGPLAAGIARWQEALSKGADSFSTHYELATLAEQRDELQLAAEHYEMAWRLVPDRRSVLVDLGRVWRGLSRKEDAVAAMLAASRGGEPRAAEAAREFLPEHYPFVSEFRRALELDPGNILLRRELAFLLLAMERQAEAEAQFRILTDRAPDDLLSAAQLGLLLQARGESDAAKPLLDRVLTGKDEELANRIRAALRIDQLTSREKTEAAQSAPDAKAMAERSIKAGFMKDALRYLQVAHEANPDDAEVMLRLGWTYNILHQDQAAFRWFNMARSSADPVVASAAQQAWQNLRTENELFRTSGWFFPLYSSRWQDLFGYGQVKTELRTGLPFRVYASARFVGDSKVSMGSIVPQYLSEDAVILGVGIVSAPWHRITAWAEAGSAVKYLSGHMLPDYRGGVSYARGVGHALRGESPGWFADTTLDAVFLSRFGNDVLLYSQSRMGYTAGPKALRAQVYWNANGTFDLQRQGWANFGEIGPGVRISGAYFPRSSYVTLDFVRGTYLLHGLGPDFYDLRVGLWYAFVH